MFYAKDSLPNGALIALMLVASVLSGVIWAVLPAIFKAHWGTNESLFTLMMNYVAIQITSYCVALWENPFGSNSVGVIHPNTEWGWFPKLFGQQYMLNVIIVMALTVAMYIYLKYTKHGYEIAVVGESENTARYAGINVKKVILRTMVISSGICGLSGFIAVSGASHTISVNTADGRGFTAIIVAWLSKFNAVVMVLFSFLLVFLDKGAVEIASKYQLNEYASEIIESIILFFILGSEFFINYRLVFRRSNKKAEKEVA
jgi:simple sugar transport system permease protein